uniref:Uncharacterized protein n=1 Tax=Lotharella vacuolata TaxID=74820 RepID=A0A0H5BGY7_9EUKA|nr:hypothetical protein [Lotharella vacuolata]
MYNSFNSIVFHNRILKNEIRKRKNYKKICKTNLNMSNYSIFFSFFKNTFRILDYYKFIYVINQKMINIIFSTNKINIHVFNPEIFQKKKFKKIFFTKFSIFQQLCYIIKKTK